MFHTVMSTEIEKLNASRNKTVTMKRRRWLAFLAKLEYNMVWVLSRTLRTACTLGNSVRVVSHYPF